MLNLSTTDPEQLDQIAYRYARRGGGTAVEGMLSISTLKVGGLPINVDGIVLAADLQGRELLPPTRRNSSSPARNFREGRRLLGEVAAEQIAKLSSAGLLPSGDRLGICLAGDMWAEPGAIRRGQSGDVRPVWEAFRKCSRWVAGVRGNHDVFVPTDSDANHGLHMLDGNFVDLDGLRLGGVGGIIGNPAKQRTRTEARFTHLIAEVISQSVDMLILHEGPRGNDPKSRGNEAIRQALSKFPGLVIFGHSWWHNPIQRSDAGSWFVNVDSRMLVLLREEK